MKRSFPEGRSFTKSRDVRTAVSDELGGGVVLRKCPSCY